MSHVNNRGFTIIELVMAMGFVSVLLIAIAMTVIQIGNIYNRGLTLKEVNQIGRSLTDELQRTISESSPFVVDTAAADTRYVVKDWGGRLCTGQYTYIWNYGSAIQDNVSTRLNLYAAPDASKIIRFIKVSDPNSSYCTEVDGAKKNVEYSKAVELVNVSEHDLAVHNFTISSSASSKDDKTNQQLYNIKFTLGTNTSGTLNGLTTSDVSCKAPSELGADPSYCSVSQFNIIALAGNSIQ
jgi:type II secretory pathway pseudopilin PulG